MKTISLQRWGYVMAFGASQVLAVIATSADAAPKGNSSIRSQYEGRVRLLADNLRWSNAALFAALERYELRSGQLSKPPRYLDVEAATREANSSKVVLLDNIKKVRANANRLRAISPVPRSWKRMDDKLVEAAWEWELGVRGLETWLLHPSSETQNGALKHLRRAQTVFDGAQEQLAQKTDVVLVGKKYFD